MGDTCATCKWFGVFQNAQGNRSTICRRNPPRVIGTFFPMKEGPVLASSSIWPTVEPGDFCGEHKINLAGSPIGSLKRA